MRKCKFGNKFEQIGKFHKWVTFDKLYGVIEDDHGFIELVHYRNVKFIDQIGLEREDSIKVDNNLVEQCANTESIIQQSQGEDPLEELKQSINVGSAIVKDIWKDISKAFDMESGR